MFEPQSEYSSPKSVPCCKSCKTPLSMESPLAGCAAPWDCTYCCSPCKACKAVSEYVSLFTPAVNSGTNFHLQSKAELVQWKNTTLAALAMLLIKKKSCLLITIQTEIRSPSARGACLCVSWNNKTHYLAADQLL